MKIWITGKVNASQVYNDIRDFLKQGYELIKPPKPEKPRIVTTGHILNRKRKKQEEIITTADIEIKERKDEVVGIVSTGHIRKKKKSAEPFGWTKGNWR